MSNKIELNPKWISQGFIDEPVEIVNKEGADVDVNTDINTNINAGKESTDVKTDVNVSGDVDLASEIRRLCKEKNAIIMAHYYTNGDVQRVADFVGDSLALAQQAQKTDANIIVMCGVHFMAETCKILSPEKIVICPDLNAGCSLADSCAAEDLRRFKDEHPDHEVISYVNTTAAVKALTDVVVTSGNAKKIVDTFPKDAKLIFGPDKNLGAYINAITGRQMLLWQGGCHVHERFTSSAIIREKTLHPEAIVLAHPECRQDVLALADVVGSTAVLLKHAIDNPQQSFIVVTESGILHEMQQSCPTTKFYPVLIKDAENPSAENNTLDSSFNTSNNLDNSSGSSSGSSSDSSSDNSLDSSYSSYNSYSSSAENSSCNECEYMKLNTLLKIYNSLNYEWPQISVDPSIAHAALKPIERMLKLSE